MPAKPVAIAMSLLVCASLAGRAGAQSLGDLAKKEEERRKTAPKADVVITDENLKPDLRASIPRDRLQRIKPENRPKVDAAIDFIAYRFAYSRSIPDHCGRRGFSVAPFVAAFRASEPAEYQRATSVLGAEGITEGALWSEAEAPMRQAAETLTPAQTQELCGTMAQNSNALLSGLRFSTFKPAAYRTLMAQ